MTRQIVASDIFVSGNSAFVLPGQFDVVVVLEGVTVASFGTSIGAGLVLNNSWQDAFIRGTVAGYYGISTSFTGTEIVVASGGLVIGEYSGIAATGTGPVEITNSGEIHGDVVGIDAAGPLTLVNTGLIGGDTAVRCAQSADNVTNLGTIIGDVALWNGDDIFDGLGGSVIGTIDLGSGNDSATGGTGADLFWDGDGADEIDTGDGDDTVEVSSDGSVDIFDAGSGRDTLDMTIAGFGTVVDLSRGRAAYSGYAYDQITGFERVLGSRGGNDTITGDDGANTLAGRSGSDRLYGGDGNDRLFGGTGGARLYGGDGNDRLIGDVSGDTLSGGNGNDLIHGSQGSDILTGGAGGDRFQWRQVTDFSGGLARVTDFAPGADVLDFAAIDPDGAGALLSFTFIGTAAITAAGQIAVRQSSGNTMIDLSLDSATSVWSIRLDGLLTLAAGDFLL
jgi:Ca2+-binding RTX toxin-like protein